MKKKVNTEIFKNIISKKFIKALLCICAVVFVYALTVNFYVIAMEKPNVKTTDEITKIKDIDAVLILGCGIRPDNTPSRMMYERLRAGAEVLECIDSSKMILSGDNSGESYNEVAVMKRVSLDNGVDEKRIVCDSFGFSTYESIYNAKEVYGCRKIIIVTQSYHMPRALYIAEKLGLEAYGAEAYLPLYPRQIIWSAREVIARNKDFLKCFFSK